MVIASRISGPYRNILAASCVFFISFGLSGQSDLIETPTSIEYFYSLLGERTSDARTESMGKASVANGNKGVNALSNPALTAVFKGIQMNTGYDWMDSNLQYLSPEWPTFGNKYNTYQNTHHRSISVCAPVFKRIHGGFTALDFLNLNIRPFDIFGKNNSGGQKEIQQYYSLNVSLAPRKISNGLAVGVNLNYLSHQTPNFKKQSARLFDIGLLYQWQADSSWTFKAGLSVSNATSVAIGYQNQSDSLVYSAKIPSSVQGSISLQKKFGPGKLSDGRNWLIVEGTLQYKNYGYKKTQTMLSSGIELLFKNVLAIRFGYYYQMNDDNSTTNIYYPNNDTFTYGCGINLPFDLLSKSRLPLNISLDFARNSTYFNYYPSINSLSVTGKTGVLGLTLNWGF
jgi:hypothetical protein